MGPIYVTADYQRVGSYKENVLMCMSSTQFIADGGIGCLDIGKGCSRKEEYSAGEL